MRLAKLLTLLVLASLVTVSCSSDDSGDGGENQSAELVGSWQLVEMNISQAIDTNDDGSTSTNLLTEVDCLRDAITINPSGDWSSTGVFPALISPITGNLYNVTCSTVINRSGNWQFSGSSLFLSGDFQATFLFSGNRLTLAIGNELPGLQSLVYEKQ